jgi:capsular polysaccharide biosynthesis protein
VLAATILVGVGVFLYRSTSPSVYESTAVIRVKLPATIVDDGPTTLFRTQSLAELATARSVVSRAAAEAQIGGSFDELSGRIDVGLRDTPGFLEVTATGSRPDDAANLAQAIVDQLIIEGERLGVTTDIVGAASVPDAPVAPNPLQEGVLAAIVAGLLTGESIVVVRKLRGRLSPIDTAPELERTIAVPTVDIREGSRSDGNLLPFFASHLADEKVITVIQMGDSNTTLPASMVAETASGLRRRVLLVDLELFEPEIQDSFGRPMRPELADVLTGRQTLEGAVRPAAKPESVDVLNARAFQSDLVGAERDASFKRLIAASTYDYAVLSVTASASVFNAMLAARRFGDAVVIAFDPAKTGRAPVRSMVTGVEAVGAHLAAILLFSDKEAAMSVSSLDIARARLPIRR